MVNDGYPILDGQYHHGCPTCSRKYRWYYSIYHYKSPTAEHSSFVVDRPSTRLRNLGSYLVKHGFVNGGQIQGMAADLTNLRTNLPMPSDFTVRWVTDAEAQKHWSEVVAEGFGMPDLIVEIFDDIMNHIDTQNILAYLGYLKDKLVASSLLIFSAGVAGIYDVTTLPAARRQGIGAIMTQIPL